MSRRGFLRALGAAGPSALLARGGARPALRPWPPLIPAPSDPERWPAWREELAAWRSEQRVLLDYRDDLYRRADLAWAARCFACAFVMLDDLAVWDPEHARFTLTEFLAEGSRVFGGYDALVWWQAYPRIGFDDRNQFDFYRDRPGGLDALRELARACHTRGVRVFVAYNPWDTGTRREERSDPDALAELVARIEADGIFLDTLDHGTDAFRAELDAARPGVVLESELALPVDSIHDHHLSWAQWLDDSAAPGVLRNKWFERRHLQHQIRRWDRDHSGELQCAWMNGSGMLVWENVFGSWVGWNGRDRSILRSMLPIQRRYADLFAGEGWTPLVPAERDGVYASLWTGRGLRLWTLVNRTGAAVEGPLLRTGAGDAPVFDLILGQRASTAAPDGPIHGTIPARGIGAFVSGPAAALGPDFDAFLESQGRLCAGASQDVAFPARSVQSRAAPRPAPRDRAPAGTVELPAAALRLEVDFRIRECGFHDSMPPGGPLHGSRRFTREVRIARCAIETTPVTNAAFARFLASSGYAPRHPESFLKHWIDGAPPPGRADHPVVYVDLDDARAYAAWAGRRLPTEAEWQYAAGGAEQRVFPWGDAMRDGVCNDGSAGGTTAVTAFPAGRSPFGCDDMCGNVWHWTESEGSDGRTRFCILKGGSWYRARGSDWYADGGPQPCRFAAKFLLSWPGLDRCATIGFRCVAVL